MCHPILCLLNLTNTLTKETLASKDELIFDFENNNYLNGKPELRVDLWIKWSESSIWRL